VCDCHDHSTVEFQMDLSLFVIRRTALGGLNYWFSSQPTWKVGGLAVVMHAMNS